MAQHTNDKLACSLGTLNTCSTESVLTHTCCLPHDCLHVCKGSLRFLTLDRLLSICSSLLNLRCNLLG